MEPGTDYKIPLSELLAILKKNGYEVSIERILEIQSVLLSTDLSSLHLSGLKFIITPILAKNAEDQQNIYRIIDAYVSEKIKPRKEPSFFIRWMSHKHLVFGLKIAGFLLVITTAILLFFFQKNRDGKITADNPQQFVPRDTLVFPATPANTVQQGPQQRPIPPSISTRLEYNGQPIVPVKQNIILQIAGAFGLGLGAILYYIIFYERKKIMEAKKQAKEKEDNDGVLNKPGNTEAPEQLLSAFLQFPDNNFLIQKTKEFSTIRTNLKRPALIENIKLNVKESVLSTTKNAGFPSLVFDGQWKERRYLFLIDHTAPDAHINQLWNFFIHFLESTNIHIRKYFYEEDARIVKDAAGHVNSLGDLSYEYADHHLIIMGDCRSFLDSGRLLQNDLSTCFQKWDSRFVITPLPLSDWSYSEQKLQESSFQLIPAEIAGIELLSKAISEDANVKPGILASRIKDKYAVLNHEFRTLAQIKEYLDDEILFQVICSLAVYPRLNWNITLALFAAIVKTYPEGSGKPSLDYDTLLKISRIPWLHTSQWTQSTRLQLLDSLEPATEIIARETILNLLNEIDPLVARDSPASQELKIQARINSFFLYAHDPQRYKQYADVKNDFLHYWKDLDEWSLKERTKNGLMPLNGKGQTTTVEEFVLQEEQFEKRNVTFLRIVLLTLPAATLYILLTLFKPTMVYPGTYEPVSFTAFIKKDPGCNKEISRVIVSRLDRFDTINVKKGNDLNYLPIEKVEYNRPVGLTFEFTDNTSVDVPVEAKDSAVVVNINCR